MTDQHLCPTCGRRPSERHAECGTKSSASGPYPDRCPDPIHDRADACEEMLALLRRLTGYETHTLGYLAEYGDDEAQAKADYRETDAFLSRFPEESE